MSSASLGTAPNSRAPASLPLLSLHPWCPLLKCRHSEVEEGLPYGVFTCTSRMLAHGRFSSRAAGRLTLCLRSSPVFCFGIHLPPLSPLSCASQKSLISMVSNLAVFGPMVCAFLVLVGKAFPTPPPNQKPRIRRFSSIPCRVFISLTCLPFMGGRGRPAFHTLRIGPAPPPRAPPSRPCLLSRPHCLGTFLDLSLWL